MLGYHSKVLLPKWLLDQQETISEQIFLTHVRKYLTRYPDYALISIEGAFAFCDRVEEGEKEDEQTLIG